MTNHPLMVQPWLITDCSIVGRRPPEYAAGTCLRLAQSLIVTAARLHRCSAYRWCRHQQPGDRRGPRSLTEAAPPSTTEWCSFIAARTFNEVADPAPAGAPAHARRHRGAVGTKEGQQFSQHSGLGCRTSPCGGGLPATRHQMLSKRHDTRGHPAPTADACPLISRSPRHPGADWVRPDQAGQFGWSCW